METTNKNKMPSIDSDNDFERICAILCPEIPADEDGEFDPPEASLELIEKYLNFLTPYLEPNLRLHAIESTGYFSWEERYIWSGNNSLKKEHKKLMQEYASTSDFLKLVSIDGIDKETGILVKVRRPKDKKLFVIPLSDLKTVDENIIACQFIEDYACYITNYLNY